MPLQSLFEHLAAQKLQLTRLRELAPNGLSNFDHSQDLELTYTSNAIEGNTLTAIETTLVVEQGITIAGKPLRDHLEAIDHFEAIRYVRDLARRREAITEMDVRSLHRLVMLRSDPAMAGRYADQGRFVLTNAGRHAFPSPAEIPALMGAFAAWMSSQPTGPATAFAAHRGLVEIHPFNDGNGRTARLLMNLILIHDGYPPVAIRPSDRPAYLEALQQRDEAFDRMLSERLNETIQEAITALRQAVTSSP